MTNTRKTIIRMTNTRMIRKRLNIRKLSRSKVSSKSPYTNIDWEKASLLFKKSASQPNSVNDYPQVKEILHLLAIVGKIGFIFAFPKAAYSLRKIILGRNKYDNWRVRKIFRQLEKQKYIAIKENADNSLTVKITEKGLIRTLTYELEKMRLLKPKKWDGKWRVVIFDIPNKYNRVRDLFRTRLIQLGLFKLQESVYISPFQCFDEIEFLRELYGVAFTVRYLLVEKVEDDLSLKRHFNLR